MATGGRRITIKQKEEPSSNDDHMEPSTVLPRSQLNPHQNGINTEQNGKSQPRSVRGSSRILNSRNRGVGPRLQSSSRARSEIERTGDYGPRDYNKGGLVGLLKTLSRESEFRRRKPNAHEIESLVFDPANIATLSRNAPNYWSLALEALKAQGTSFSEVKNILFRCLAQMGLIHIQYVQRDGAEIEFFKWLSQLDDQHYLVHTADNFFRLPLASEPALQPVLGGLIHCVLQTLDYEYPEVIEKTQLFQYLSEHHQDVFSQHLHDVFDLMSGLSLDKPDLCDPDSFYFNATLDFLSYTRDCWLKQPSVYYQFLQDFLCDYSNYEEIEMEPHSKVTLFYRLAAYMMELLRMKELTGSIEFSHPIMNYPHSSSIDAVINTILTFHDGVITMDPVYGHLRMAVLELLEKWLEFGSPSNDLLPNFLNKQLDQFNQLESGVQATTLSLLYTMIHRCSIELMDSSLNKFYSMDLEINFTQSVIERFLSIYNLLFSFKAYQPSVNLRYNVVRQKILDEVQSLAELYDKPDVPREEIETRGYDCQVKVILYLSSLGVIARETSCMFVVHGLSPSLFNFLVSDLLKTFSSTMTKQPLICEAVLRLLHTHSICRKHFASKSEICGHSISRNSSVNSYNSFLSSVPSTELCELLESIPHIINTAYAHTPSLRLLIEFMRLVIVQISETDDEGLEHPLVLSTVNLLVTIDSSLLLKGMLIDINTILYHLLSQSDPSGSVLRNVADFVQYYVGSEIEEVSEAYLEVLPYLPYERVNGSKADGRKVRYILNMRHAIKTNKFSVMSRETFHTVASHLFKLENSDKLDMAMMQDAALDSEPTTLPLSQLLHHSGLLEYWTMWQLASYCVSHSLKTPIGKAGDTFGCIDHVIKQIAADCKPEVSPKSTVKPRTVGMILQFVENLEKLIFNAYEGCSGFIQTENKNVRRFFHMNRRTCVEFMFRLRLSLITIADAFSDPTTVIRHAYDFIPALIKREATQDLEQVVIYLLKAYTSLGCSEAVQGVLNWYRVGGAKRAQWIKPIVLLSSQRYEKGANELRSCIATLLNPTKAVESNSSSDTPIQIQQRLNQPSTGVLTYTIQQLTDSYVKLQSWTEASVWFNQVQQYKQEFGFLGSLDPCTDSHKMAVGENDNLELASWSVNGQLDSLMYTKNSTWTDDQRSSLYSIVTQQLTTDYPPIVNDRAFLLLSQHHGCVSRLVHEVVTSAASGASAASVGTRLEWLLHLKNLHESDDPTELKLHCSSQARKTENYQLSGELLRELTQVSDIKDIAKLPGVNMTSLKMKRYAAKLLYNGGDVMSALDAMRSVIEAPHDDTDEFVMEQRARSFLTIHKWLQADLKLPGGLLAEGGVSQGFNSWITELSSNQFTQQADTIPKHDRMLGSIVEASTVACPSLAKTWIALANWSHRWSRVRSQNTQAGLTEDEKEQVAQILPTDIESEVLSRVISLMSQPPGLLLLEEDSDETPDLTDDRSEIRRRLSDICELLDDNALDALVELWKQAAKRMYHLHELTAESYFKFLQLDHDSQSDKSANDNVTATLRLLKLVVKHAYELRDVLEAGLTQTPTAPWRSIIPQLFSRFNHPEAYVRQSIAELLARLATESPHLIVYPAMVGSQTNKSVSGSDHQQTSDDGKSTGEDSSDEDEEDSSGESELSDTYSQLVKKIADLHPVMIQQVGLFVRELCRITVTWDELWLGQLNQLHHTIHEKAKQLRAEVQKVDENKDLSAEDKKLLISSKRLNTVNPIIHSLERINAITSKRSETRHEQWFQETYQSYIDRGLRKLNNPTRAADLLNDWNPFKQMHSALTVRSQRRTSHILKMKELSSVLAGFADTNIPLPGQNPGSGEAITLSHVGPQVQILATKTKPKKLAFNGSDGRRYTYLFKGLEDLHLDERIMQLLSIVNNMLTYKSSSDTSHGYQARFYSVTPLGLRSGLIQWVDGCLPLFQLYKRWQIREAQAKSNSANPPLPKPSELYYAKLLPLLATLFDQKNLKPTERGPKDAERLRKEWPVSAQVETLKQLVADTPGYLVSKELWCNSTSTREWWDMMQTYSRSTAVMSAIGYILGLGDRHLDNLLLDISNGELVHIDYNVCFDKGKSLRVPEKVPFRLTQNLNEALGPTGVEGLFRCTFERTIRTLRNGKDTVLTLLEAFVYDPLIDWTTGNEAGYAGAFYGGNYAIGTAAKDYRSRKKEMEKEITRSMLSIRVTETKSAWLYNKSEIARCLADLKHKLDSVRADKSGVTEAMETARRCDEALRYIDGARREGPALVDQLQARYKEYKKVEIKRREASNQLKNKLKEWTVSVNIHQSLASYLTESALSNIKTRVTTLSLSFKPASLCTQSFFSNTDGLAGQAAQVAQCEELELSLQALLKRRQGLIFGLIEELEKYSRTVSEFSSSYFTETVLSDVVMLVQQLHDDTSVASCERVRTALQTNPRLRPPAAHVSRCAVNEATLRSALTADQERCKALEVELNREKETLEELVDQCDEKIALIDSMANNSGSNNSDSVLTLLLPRLTETARNYLKLEGLAFRAGNRLPDLTSSSGDWYLYELSSTTESILDYLSLALIGPENSQSDSSTLSAAQATVSCMRDVYNALQDLVKVYQESGLSSVIRALNISDPSLNSLQDELETRVFSQIDLKGTVNQLEVALRNVIFGTKDGAAEVMKQVASLEKEFQLIVTPTSEAGLPGHLSRLDEAFDAVFGLYEQAMDTASGITAHRPWNKVDIIRDAKSMQQAAYNERTSEIVKQIYFIRKLQTLKSMFNTCSNYASVFTAGSKSLVYLLMPPAERHKLWARSEDLESGEILPYDALTLPIRSFVSQVVSKQLLGVTSQALGYAVCDLLNQIGLDVDKEIALKDFGASSKVLIEDLLKKCIQINSLSSQTLSFTMIQLESLWKRASAKQRLERAIELSRLQIYQQSRQLICYQWLHEGLLRNADKQHKVVFTQPTRASILNNIQQTLHALAATNKDYNRILDGLKSPEDSIMKRLRWSAHSNATLSDIIVKYEAAQAERGALLQEEEKLAKEVASKCGNILHLEKFRYKESSESTQLLGECSQIINRCKDFCSTAIPESTLSDVQLFILSLMKESDRELKGTKFFTKAIELVRSLQSGMNQKAKYRNKSAAATAEKFKLQLLSLQQGTIGGVFTQHCAFYTEIQGVLKTLKLEEAQSDVESDVATYMTHYNERFLQNILKLTKWPITELTEATAGELDEVIRAVEASLDRVFDGLLDLAQPISALTDSTSEKETNKSSRVRSRSPKRLNLPIASLRVNSPVNSQGSSRNKEPSSSRPSSKVEKVKRDSRTGKVYQARNITGFNNYKRVKMKIEGKELDPNNRMSVTEQVDYVIREAASLENQALMYEGWTSWV